MSTKRKFDDFKYPTAGAYHAQWSAIPTLQNSMKTYLHKYKVSSLKTRQNFNITFQFKRYMVPEESLETYLDARSKTWTALHEYVDPTNGCRLILPLVIRTFTQETSKEEFKVNVDKLIGSIHHIVTRFIPDATLLVYKKEVIETSPGKVELRFHLIYNKKVAADMGSQIAGAASTVYFKYRYIIKNIYNSTNIKFQPIMAFSVTSCRDCTIKSNFHCLTCKARGYMSITNGFKLAYVVAPDNTRNPEMLQTLLSDPRRQIQLTSLLTMSKEQLIPKTVPIEFPLEIHKNMHHKEVTKILSTCMRFNNVTARDTTRSVFNITSRLEACFRNVIIKQHAYRFHEFIGFDPEIEMYRRKGNNDNVLRIKLIGEGSTFCPKANECFVRNCTELWVHVNVTFRAWFRCNCGSCSDFHSGYDQITLTTKPDTAKSYSKILEDEMFIICRKSKTVKNASA